MSSFRQRVGKLNWKHISSLDLTQIIEDYGITELQGVLDTVTFSKITKTDIVENAVDNTCQLVSLMQLIIEYLLQCQESQYKSMQTLYQKNKALKAKNKLLKSENSKLLEDNKIYQQQLLTLRYSLTKTHDLIRDVNGIDLQKLFTKENNAINLEFIKHMFADHQRSYSHDIEQMISKSLAEIVKVVQQPNKMENVAPSSSISLAQSQFNEFSNNLSKLVEVAMKSIESKAKVMNEYAAPPNPASFTDADRENRLIALEKQLTDKDEHLQNYHKHLESLESELNDRDKQLSSMQRQLESDKLKFEAHVKETERKLDLMELQKREMMTAIQNAEQNSIGVDTSQSLITFERGLQSKIDDIYDDFYTRNRQLGGKLLLNSMRKSKSNLTVSISHLTFLWAVLNRRLILSLDHWKSVICVMRKEEEKLELRKQLQFVESSRVYRENELLQLMETEKVTAVTEQTKLLLQVRMLEEQRLKDLQELNKLKEDLRTKQIELVVPQKNETKMLDTSTSIEFDKNQKSRFKSSYWVFDKRFENMDENDLISYLGSEIRMTAEKISHEKNVEFVNKVQEEINKKIILSDLGGEVSDS